MLKAYLYSDDGGDYSDNKWDYGLLKEIFDKNNIEQIRVTEIPFQERSFVIIPGAYCSGKEKKINNELSKIDRVVLFITGDECALFDVDKIKHKNISIWIQTPHPKHENYNRFFLGAASHIKNNIPEYTNKDIDVFFAGQITHQRRKELAKVMPAMKNALYCPTEGFAQGDPPSKYYKNMAASKVVPAPSGAAVIDNFRFFEALEMLALPVGDLKDASGRDTRYYEYVYGKNIPVPLTNDWKQLPKIMEEIMNDYPANMHRAVCWWLKYKRDFANKIMSDYHAS